MLDTTLPSCLSSPLLLHHCLGPDQSNQSLLSIFAPYLLYNRCVNSGDRTEGSNLSLNICCHRSCSSQAQGMRGAGSQAAHLL